MSSASSAFGLTADGRLLFIGLLPFSSFLNNPLDFAEYLLSSWGYSICPKGFT